MASISCGFRPFRRARRQHRPPARRAQYRFAVPIPGDRDGRGHARLFPVDGHPARAVSAILPITGLSAAVKPWLVADLLIPSSPTCRARDLLLREYRAVARSRWRDNMAGRACRSYARAILGKLQGASRAIFQNGLHEFVGEFVDDNDKLGSLLAQQCLLRVSKRVSPSFTRSSGVSRRRRRALIEILRLQPKEFESQHCVGGTSTSIRRLSGRPRRLRKLQCRRSTARNDREARHRRARRGRHVRYGRLAARRRGRAFSGRNSFLRDKVIRRPPIRRPGFRGQDGQTMAKTILDRPHFLMRAMRARR